MLPPPGFSPSAVDFTTATSIVSATTTATSLAVEATAAIVATIASVSHPKEPPPPDNGECKLLGPFALFIQAALGGLALLALVFKRWRERPQRPVKVWAFDASKQVVGSVLVHIANLLMSMLSSGQFSVTTVTMTPPITRRDEGAPSGPHGDDAYKPNPCSFYFLNLAIDTTIGIPILILLLRILTGLFALTPMGNPRESIQSGNYGSPPKAWWWFKQCIIYFIGLMGMKLCVLVIFLVLPWIAHIGDWALKWTEGNEDLQVFFVMLFFPVIMNATQYYIIDSFIKKQITDHEPIPSDDESDVGSTDSPTDDERKKAAVKTSNIKKDRDEYDPDFDGESSATVIGSGSSAQISKDDDTQGK